LTPPMDNRPIIIATRGSALALAQAHLVLEQCRAVFPKLQFELKIIKTTGDKLQTASLAKAAASLPKGLFTKELESALLKHKADLAVHSLKDLPVELPAGLALGAVGKRADVRDVLIYRSAKWLEEEAENAAAIEWTPGQRQRRGFAPKLRLNDLPPSATVATSSVRRKTQLLHLRPDLKIVELRGNVPTRLQRLAERAEFDAIILAAAGLDRLHFSISQSGELSGDAVPDGLLATKLEVDEMLPAVGQGAIGIEIRADDERMAAVCQRLNHYQTFQAVTAERAFLKEMGGGCHSSFAAHADVVGESLRLKALAEIDGKIQRAEARRPIQDAVELGRFVAAQLKGS